MELHQTLPTGKSPRYRNLTVCSSDLVNGTYVLPMPIQCRGVRLTSVILANTWRTVDSNNNKLSVLVRDIGDLNNYIGTVALRAGNYNINTLMAELVYQLNQTSTWQQVKGTSALQNNWAVTLGVAGQISDPRIVIKNLATSDGVNHYYINFDMNQTTAHKLLGLLRTTRVFNTQQWGDVLPRLNRVTVLNVSSQELGSRLFDNWHSSFPMQSSIIFTAPVTGSFGQCFEYTNVSGSQMAWFDDSCQSPEEVFALDLSLNDDENHPIDFNGHPWYVNLQFLL